MGFEIGKLRTSTPRNLRGGFFFYSVCLFQKFLYIRNIKLNVMASRKTVSVKDMIAYANQQLSRVDDYATKDFKSGICTMIESLLHMTDNYSGFMFNNNSDSEIDTVGYYSRTYFTSNKLLK